VPAIKEKIKIGGIKLSSELVQLTLVNKDRSSLPASTFFQILSEHQINMPFVTASLAEGRPCASCCISPEDLRRANELVQSDNTLKGQVNIVHAVGLASLFPHQYRLKILGSALIALGKAQLPLYGLASSISTITFVTDYARLNEAVISLSEYMDLPLNHAPFSPGTAPTEPGDATG